MKKRLNINVEIEIVEEFDDNNNVIGRVYYPNEGNKIQIKKGLNAIDFSCAIHHEIGHLFDWYLSSGNQSNDKEVREASADVIGESLRWKESS